VFVPALMKAAAMRLRGLLWIAAHRDLDPPPPLPPEGRVCIPVGDAPSAFYAACGYKVIGATGYRLDMLERFSAEVRKLAREKTKLLPPATLSLLGINAETGVVVLKALGFKAKLEEVGISFVLRRRKHHHAKPAEVKVEARPDSPFARLKELIPS